MRLHVAVIIAAVSASLPASALTPEEIAANHVLAEGLGVPASLASAPSLHARAAEGMLRLVAGEQGALEQLRELEASHPDCSLRAVLATHGVGETCSGRPAGSLLEMAAGPPVAARIVGPEPGAQGSLFAATLAASLEALAPQGGVRLDSTAARFRVSAASVLEGTSYLDDRILVVARRGTASTEHARQALRRLGRARPDTLDAGDAELAGKAATASGGRPTLSASAGRRGPAFASHEDLRLGLRLVLPSSWEASSRDATAEALHVGPPGRTIVTARLLESEERRRSSVARRRPPSPEDALPDSARRVRSEEIALAGGLGATLASWIDETGEPHVAIIRVLRTSEGAVAIVGKADDAESEDATRRVLAQAEPLD